MPTNDDGQKRGNLDHLSRFETHWEGLGVDFADFFPCLFRTAISRARSESQERQFGSSRAGKYKFARQCHDRPSRRKPAMTEKKNTP